MSLNEDVNDEDIHHYTGISQCAMRRLRETYYKTGEVVHGSLFENLVGVIAEPGTILTVYTTFFVDHNEPLAALKIFQDSGKCYLRDMNF